MHSRDENNHLLNLHAWFSHHFHNCRLIKTAKCHLSLHFSFFLFAFLLNNKILNILWERTRWHWHCTRSIEALKDANLLFNSIKFTHNVWKDLHCIYAMLREHIFRTQKVVSSEVWVILVKFHANLSSDHANMYVQRWWWQAVHLDKAKFKWWI